LGKLKGIALTIGLNSVDAEHYDGWDGKLVACEFDAKDMANIAENAGFQVKTLLTRDANRKNVIDEISKAASDLQPGDIFMLSYSGHGGQILDLNQDEYDRRDETWCLYDAQLIDDETHYLLSTFKSGVRILTFSDSCHSGSVIKAAGFEKNRLKDEFRERRIKCLPELYEDRVYEKNKVFYDKLANKQLIGSIKNVKASALLISGCMDSQVSFDGDRNGLYTGTLRSVWDNGNFEPSGQYEGYRAFHKAILDHMPFEQTPVYFRVGTENLEFEKQKPFTI